MLKKSTTLNKAHMGSQIHTSQLTCGPGWPQQHMHHAMSQIIYTVCMKHSLSAMHKSMS